MKTSSYRFVVLILALWATACSVARAHHKNVMPSTTAAKPIRLFFYTSRDIGDNRVGPFHAGMSITDAAQFCNPLEQSAWTIEEDQSVKTSQGQCNGNFYFNNKQVKIYLHFNNQQISGVSIVIDAMHRDFDWKLQWNIIASNVLSPFFQRDIKTFQMNQTSVALNDAVQLFETLVTASSAYRIDITSEDPMLPSVVSSIYRDFLNRGSYWTSMKLSWKFLSSNLAMSDGKKITDFPPLSPIVLTLDSSQAFNDGNLGSLRYGMKLVEAEKICRFSVNTGDVPQCSAIIDELPVTIDLQFSNGMLRQARLQPSIGENHNILSYQKLFLSKMQQPDSILFFDGCSPSEITYSGVDQTKFRSLANTVSTDLACYLIPDFSNSTEKTPPQKSMNYDRAIQLKNPTFTWPNLKNWAGETPSLNWLFTSTQEYKSAQAKVETSLRQSTSPPILQSTCCNRHNAFKPHKKTHKATQHKKSIRRHKK